MPDNALRDDASPGIRKPWSRRLLLRKRLGDGLRRLRGASLRTKAAVAVAVVVALALSFILWRRTQPELLRIAYFGRIGDSTFDELHRLVLGRYVDELNDRVKGVRFEIVYFDVENDPARLRHFYETVVGPDPTYVVAIDNTWGRHLQPASSAIRQFRMPVIAINADKRDTDFGGHALFFGHSDNVPTSVAAFITQALGVNQLILIAEADYDLTAKFREVFGKSGIATEREFSVPTETVTPTDSLALFKALQAGVRDLDGKVIVLNTHRDWGARILRFLDANVRGARFIGGPYVAAGLTNFAWTENGNELLLLTDPNDALPERIFTDIRSFRKRHPDVFGDVNLNVPLYVKRCLDAVSVIEAAAEKSGSRLGRSDLVELFRGLRGSTLETAYDLYEFDDALLLQNEVTWERHARGEIASYPYQLNRAGKVIPNVNFGIELLNVANLDFNENTFDAELYYWLMLDQRYSGTESLIHFRNARGETADKLLIERRKGDTLYRLYRKSGSFAADFQLGDFPLDRQELVIGVEIINPADSVRISFDYESFAASRAGRGEFHLPAWNVSDTYVSVDNLITRSLRGDPTVEDGLAQKFKRLNVRVNVVRRFLPPFIGYVLPLVMIGVVALSLLFVRDISFGSIGDVSVGVFLSIITYSVSYATTKPESGVLTKADFLFSATFLTVLCVFLLMLYVNAITESLDPDSPLRQRIRVMRYAIAAAYAVALVLIPLT